VHKQCSLKKNKHAPFYWRRHEEINLVYLFLAAILKRIDVLLLHIKVALAFVIF